MTDAAQQVTDQILLAMRNEHRRDIRELASRMAQFSVEMMGLRDQMRDMQGRLNDVIALQVTKGDLESIHFELNRFVERMDALEADGA